MAKLLGAKTLAVWISVCTRNEQPAWRKSRMVRKLEVGGLFAGVLTSTHALSGCTKPPDRIVYMPLRASAENWDLL